MYFEYIFERHGTLSYVIPDKGFATFSIEKSEFGAHIIVYDFFVRKEYRGGPTSQELLDNLYKIAKENQCNYVVTQIDKSSRNWKKALQFQITCGKMSIYKETDDVIYLERYI